MKYNYSYKLEPVKDFNDRMKAYSQYPLVFSVGTGAYLNEPRKRGWVVSIKGIKPSRYSGYRFFSNLEKAKDFIDNLGRAKDFIDNNKII